MKKTIGKFTLVLFLLAVGQLWAQTKIAVSTPGNKCKVALIADEEAENAEYGWWSVWSDLSKSNRVAAAPTTFEAQPGSYTLVVYWENNNDQSDGIALEKIRVGSYLKEISYTFGSEHFTEWNCLSCPWLCIFDGKEYVKHSEVIQDVTGYDNRTTTATELSASTIIDGKLKFKIQEEKNEISYLDQIQLKVGDRYLPVTNTSGKKNKNLASTDDSFVVLKKGDKIELEVRIPASWEVSGPVYLEVSGYYDPEPEFISAVTESLLKGNK